MSNQLTRSAQARQQALKTQAQLRARNQFRPQGVSQADVAGCGQGGWRQGGFPSPGGSPDPWASNQYFEGLPNLAPMAFPGVLESNLYRLGAIAETTAGRSVTIEVAPANGASLYVSGILTLNDPFQVLIHRIEQGSVGFSPLADVDAAAFNTDECYCAIELGCANNLTPLIVEYSAIGTPSVQPFLNIIFVGTFQGGWGSCGVPYGNGYNTPLPSMPGAVP